MTGVMTTRAAENIAMRSGIADALLKFAEVRASTIRMAASLTAEQADFAPDRSSWSVAQILDHVLRTEALYRAQMKRLLSLAREGRGSNIAISLREVDLALPFVPQALMPLMAAPLAFMNMFVPSAAREAMLRVPLMKAKSPKVVEPAAARPIAELRGQLASSLAETEELFAGDLPPRVGRVTMSHPVLGRNTIANVIGLMTAHEQRHAVQIGGVMRSTGFPKF